MGVPTRGEEFAKFIEHVRLAQEAAAMLSHLHAAQDDKLIAQGWLGIEELFKKVAHNATKLATGKMQ